MRIYLEANETEGEFVRLDVTDKTQAEQDAILVSLKDFMTGVTCVFSRHWCWHDGTPGNHPLCEWEEL